MISVQPPKPRYTVDDTFAALRITIPARRSWSIVLFLGIWLSGWVVGEVLAGTIMIRGLAGLLTGKTETVGDPWGTVGGLGLLFWLALWTVGGVVALAMWLWNVAGKETVFINGESLTVRTSVFGIGRSRQYSAVYVDRLRASGDRDRSQSPWGGGLTFDYGGIAVNFGLGLSQTEANEIAALIGSRFPALTRAVE